MAVIREPTPTLNDGTGKGVAIAKVLEGDSPSGKNAIPALVAKKRSDGSLTYIQTNDLGQVIVETSPDIEARLWESTTSANVSPATPTNLAVIPLLTNKVYRGLAVNVTSGQMTKFSVIWNNNGVSTVLPVSLAVGAKPSVSFDFPSFEMTSGSTGTQELKIVAEILDGVATDLFGFLSTTEIQDT